MRPLEIQLFGALRGSEPGAVLRLQSAATTIGALRADVQAAIAPRWPASSLSLLQRSAFASPTTILRDADAVPAEGLLALLPPVSGG